MILLLLLACSGEKATPACETFAPEPWDPTWEDEVRVDEATAAWASGGAGAIDPAATTGCVEAPCLGVTGPVTASVDLLLNRGVDHTLSGTVTTDVAAEVVVTHTTNDGVTRVLLSRALDPGTHTLAEPFVVAYPGPDVTVSLVLEAEGTATLDGFSVTGKRWAATTDAPVDTVRLGFLVHVEDDVSFQVEPDTWTRRATVLAGLSETLAAHGAKLGIQADATFVRGAPLWDPGWIAAREEEGAGWSVHIHDESEPEMVEPAIRDGRVALREVGLGTTDLNGGFVTAPWSAARRAGITSLTAFKDPATQLGLPRVQVQPWRPGDGVGAEDPAAFLLHDPGGPLVYLPGHDIREVEHARFPASAANVLSQVLAHARPDHVNVWYFVLHVDGFGPDAEDGAAFDSYVAERFADDLAAYDAFLTDTVDPLVAAGHVVYDTPVGMAQAWHEWSGPCADED